jgi:DHA1 family inner membrane transport protein
MKISMTEEVRITAMLSVCNFIIGVGAFVVVGVLNPIADTFQISASEAGFMMTAYAIAYAIGSPLCVAFSGRYSRRNVLMLGMALFGLGSLLTAIAATPSMLHGARIITALGAGMVTPVAAAVALAAAAPGQHGKALARVFFGLTLAQVLGVPVGSFIGYMFGWQTAFFIVVILSTAAFAGVWRVVPVQLAFQVNTLSTLRDALFDWRSIFSVLYTSTFIATFYVLYTYFAPLLAQSMNYG